MPRNYTPKGGNGGKRSGAGRKPGSKNTLGYGQVKALLAVGMRVPEGASDQQKAIADRAQERILHVMEGLVNFKLAQPVLKAATHIREEICGPVRQRVEHSFGEMTDEQLEARYSALVAAGTATISGGAGTTAVVAASEHKGGGDASLGPEGDESKGGES